MVINQILLRLLRLTIIGSKPPPAILSPSSSSPSWLQWFWFSLKTFKYSSIQIFKYFKAKMFKYLKAEMFICSNVQKYLAIAHIHGELGSGHRHLVVRHIHVHLQLTLQNICLLFLSAKKRLACLTFKAASSSPEGLMLASQSHT